RRIRRSRTSAPYFFAMSDGFTMAQVGPHQPVLSPVAPEPKSLASRRRTERFCRASVKAADNPVKPPPITANSTLSRPSNERVSGAGGAFTCHNVGRALAPGAAITPPMHCSYDFCEQSSLFYRLFDADA